MTGQLPRQQDPAEGDRATIEHELERTEKQRDRREQSKGKPQTEKEAADRKRADTS
jgi:hypothetical protein